MLAETNQPDYNLVSKYLAGEASPAEAMLLHDWMEDPENKKAFDEMLKTWNMTPGPEEMSIPAADQSWAQIDQRIKTPNQKNTLRVFLPYAIAAAITGIVLLIAFTWNNDVSNRPKLEQQTALSLITKSAGNAILTHNMPDGSIININKGSDLTYSTGFNKINREVQLKGEAFFNVAHNVSKPFIIETEGLKIKVTGTAFNVRKLPTEKSIEVQVKSGSVEMYTEKQSITVKNGQTGIYNGQQLTLVLKEGVDINSISYATKTFSFNDLSLKEVSSYLEKAFNVSIEMDESRFSDCRITAAFEDKSLTYILEVINATLNTSYRRNGNIITIEGDGCK